MESGKCAGAGTYLYRMEENKHLALLAGEAGKVVRIAADYIHGQFGLIRSDIADVKSHNSLVSVVDKTAEDMLVKGLQSLLPEAGFLTEEETVLPSQASVRWIIDPLDGTTNFLFGVPLFTVSVALEVDEQLVLGMVHDVMGGDHYAAWTGGGAWCNGKPIRVSKNDTLAESLLATGFPYYDYGHSAAYLDVLASFMKKTRGIRRLGSAALDLAWTACGRFDAFYEYGLHPWDVAGGAVLVREAGGVVCDFEGGNTFLNGKTLVAGNEIIAALVQKEIKLYF